MLSSEKKTKLADIVLVASGDSRLSANQKCWPAQDNLEKIVISTFEKLGRNVVRGEQRTCHFFFFFFPHRFF